VTLRVFETVLEVVVDFLVSPLGANFTVTL
jgi:hypothetical protein